MTEFLPISSTAHLLLVDNILNIETSKAYIAYIQLCAILAVFVSYRIRTLEIISQIFAKDFKFAINMLIITIPTVVCGFVVYKLDILKYITIKIIAYNLIIGEIGRAHV